MTDSNEQAARTLQERWAAQDEILDFRTWLIKEALSLQSQLDSLKEAYDKLHHELDAPPKRGHNR